MSSGDELCLHWNDFAANITNTLYDLKEDKDFTDLTLVCADKRVEVHNVVLASSSNFFRRIMKDIKHSHPLIYLSGIKFKDLEAVLSFMYLWQVKLAQEDLDSFLALAEELEVKGLTPGENLSNCDANSQTQVKSCIWLSKCLSLYPSKVNSCGKSQESANYCDHHNYAAPYLPSSPRMRSTTASSVKSAENNNSGGVPLIKVEQELFSNIQIGEAVHVEDESETNEPLYPSKASDGLLALASDEDPEKIEQKGSDLRRGKLAGYYTKFFSGNAAHSKYKCNICGHLSNLSNHMLDHLEGKHFPGMFEYACDSCVKVFDTKPKLYHHRRREHSNETTK